MKPRGLPSLSADALALNRSTLTGILRPRTVNVSAMLPVGQVKQARKAKRFAVDATPYFVAAGLPAPVTEHGFVADRKWRLDYAWVAERVALEVEGAVWTNGRHTRGSGFVKDMDKYNRLAVEGWRLLRVQPRDLMTLATVKMILEAMG